MLDVCSITWALASLLRRSRVFLVVIVACACWDVYAHEEQAVLGCACVLGVGLTSLAMACFALSGRPWRLLVRAYTHGRVRCAARVAFASLSRGCVLSVRSTSWALVRCALSGRL
jgi:hypothetical protein